MKLPDANPRLYDRLNAICSALLAIGLTAAIYLSIQPDMNPPQVEKIMQQTDTQNEMHESNQLVGTEQAAEQDAPAS